MLAEEVIVPLVIDHAYVVAPAGPLAVFPVDEVQTVDGDGVMVGVDGFALIVTFAVFDAEQPAALVTVSVRPTVPDAPAVYVTLCEVAPPVMVPLVIDHE